MNKYDQSILDIMHITKESSRSDFKGIMIHHSATADGVTNDWEGIKKYHTSWRYNNQIISEDDARFMRKEGLRVTPPWRDIGYHFGIEKVGDKYLYCIGRPLKLHGAHCAGHNDTIGICLVGNYDKQAPSPVQYWLLASLCRHLKKVHGFSPFNIYNHTEYAPWKTCPGKKFSLAKLIRIVETSKI